MRTDSSSTAATTRGYRSALTLGAVGALLVTARAAAAVCAQTVSRHDRLADPSQGVLVLVAALVAALCGWLALCLVLGVVATLPGRVGRLARVTWRAVTPLALRAVTATVLGTSAVSLGASGALAGAPPLAVPPPAAPPPAVTRVTASAVAAGPTATVPASGSTPRPVVPPALPEAGWVPARPPAPPATSPDVLHLVTTTPRQHATADASQDEVVVRRGDSLWAIASRHLGPHASVEEIGAEWPRWYAANRSTIGADPDLLRPGQRLTAPSGVRR